MSTVISIQAGSEPRKQAVTHESQIACPSTLTGFGQYPLSFRRKSFCDGLLFVPEPDSWCHVIRYFGLEYKVS